jgi:2-iminobutanoate/2-iminopropanoate deaminase
MATPASGTLAAKTTYVLPNIAPPPPGTAHAVRAGDTLYVSAGLPLDADGRLREGDFLTKARQAYGNLDAVLTAAGASWRDVAKYNSYLSDPGNRAKAREAHYEYFPLYQRAGAGIGARDSVPGAAIQIDITAHFNAAKLCTLNVPHVFMTMGSPHAVRVGDLLYVTGQVPVAGDAPALNLKDLFNSSSYDSAVIGAGDVGRQVDAVYDNFSAVLHASGYRSDDIVRTHDYLSATADAASVRKARLRHLPRRGAAATLAIAPLMRPEWYLESELIAYAGEKKSVESDRLAGGSDGVAHAVLAGKTLFTSAITPTDRHGKLTGDTIDRQADQVYENLDAVLAAAGAGWDAVVHIRTYYRRREDIDAGRKVRATHLGKSLVAASDVVVAPAFPGALLQAELIAVLPNG